MSYIVRWFVTGVPRWVRVGKEDCGLRAAYANLTRNLCGLHHQPHSFSPTITCCKEEAAHTAAVVPNPLRRSISPFTATCTKRATNLIMLGSRLRHVGPCIYMVASSRPYKTPVFGDLELPAFSGGSNKFDNDWESVASRRPVRLHGVCTFPDLTRLLYLANLDCQRSNLIVIGSRLCHIGPCVYFARSRPRKTPVFGDLGLPAFNGVATICDLYFAWRQLERRHTHTHTRTLSLSLPLSLPLSLSLSLSLSRSLSLSWRNGFANKFNFPIAWF